MKKLLAVFMALSLGAFVFADEVTTEETEVVASETSENADGDESKEEK